MVVGKKFNCMLCSLSNGMTKNAEGTVKEGVPALNVPKKRRL
jgi:hypothetical protein